MASTSSAETIRPRMPDGAFLVARRHDPAEPLALALLMPDLGEDLTALDGAASRLAALGVRAFVVEHRGHGQSGGSWSLAGHLRDYRAWLWTLKEAAQGLPVIVIARGLSATLALLHEEIAHRQRARPAVPDGMLLLDPVARGMDREPLRAIFGRLGACRGIPRRERLVLRRFSMPPVRVQTPTIIFASGPLDGSAPHDPLRLVFGNARIRRATWLHPTTRLAVKRADIEIAGACEELLAMERPHRFATRFTR